MAAVLILQFILLPLAEVGRASASASAKGKALAGVSFYLYLEGNSLPLRVDALGKLSTADDRDSRLLFTDLP